VFHEVKWALILGRHLVEEEIVLAKNLGKHSIQMAMAVKNIGYDMINN